MENSLLYLTLTKSVEQYIALLFVVQQIDQNEFEASEGETEDHVDAYVKG